MTTWTTCPDCGWNYERHGDTHMSTRFNCARSRNTVQHNFIFEGYINKDYTPVISLANADRQTAKVVSIMETEKLNFGPATSAYIERQLDLFDDAP